MNDEVRPNFLLVGAHKCATTALATSINRHPDAFVPKIKEPHHFVSDEVAGRIPITIADPDEYAQLFAAGRGAKRRGEASVLYLYYADIAIPRIKNVLGSDVSIVISLRNPVDRAYSAYWDVRRGNVLETLSFEDALAAENDRAERRFGTPTMNYRAIGEYARQVEKFQDAFSHVQVVLYDDVQRDFIGVAEQIFSFLELDPAAAGLGEPVHENRGGAAWRRPALRAIAVSPTVTQMRRAAKKRMPGLYARARNAAQSGLLDAVPPMDAALRARLAASYAPDIDALAALIGRDLSAWR